MSDEGSLYKVPLTRILRIENHPNADRLEIATVYGFQVVVQKNKYRVGDVIIYIPIDSILPYELEAKIFGPDSKIKLNKNRVRQIKIRQFVSQGMIVPINDPTIGIFVDPELMPVESDLAESLNITKYEPVVKDHTPNAPKLRNRRLENPAFRKYNGVTNIKWAPTRFADEEVIIQLKVHGSHVRFAKAPFSPNTLWKKILKFLHLAPQYEFVYGSNNVELTNRKTYKGFYDGDIYGECLKKYAVEEKIKDGEFVHGEIYGPGIQSNYHYGKKEHALIIFDVRVLNPDGTQTWLNPEEVEKYAEERGFDFVPVLYRGLFDRDVLDNLTVGPDLIYPEHDREGVVVKSRFKYDIEQNKQALKSINPDYLADETNTDLH